MELQTISEVSKSFGISPRMLRYYEQAGLIKSLKKADYSYRVYDDTALKRLHQIIILRKLRISVKQIFSILNNNNIADTVEIFRQNIEELNDEINALSTIRSILSRFIAELRIKTGLSIKADLPDDETLLSMIKSLPMTKNHIKEKISIDDLNRANNNLSRLQDVRIIYIPPMTVASSHHVGEGPELVSETALYKFVRESGLLKKKPDARHFGFDNPVPQFEGAFHGYERWVSIPDNMKVPPPLSKKKFHGGLYAAHAIAFGNFDHWKLLYEWVTSSDKYDNDWYSIRCTPHAGGMDFGLEEHLNYCYNLQNPDFDESMTQLDLLCPIKEK